MGRYIGNNQFIHAPEAGDVELSGYYQQQYAGAVRRVG